MANHYQQNHANDTSKEHTIQRALRILVLLPTIQNDDILLIESIKALGHTIDFIDTQKESADSIENNTAYDTVFICQEANFEHAQKIINLVLTQSFPRLILIKNDPKDDRYEKQIEFDQIITAPLNLDMITELLDRQLSVVNHDPTTHQTPNILICVDNKEICDFLLNTFKPFRTHGGTNCLTTIRMLKHQPFDILISTADPMRIQAIKKIKQTLPHLEIILVSDLINSQNILQNIPDEVAATLSYPLPSEEIIQKVEHIRKAQRHTKNLQKLEQTIQLGQIREQTQPTTFNNTIKESPLFHRIVTQEFIEFIDFFQEGILIVECQTNRIREANHSIINLLGYSKEELLHYHIQDLEIAHTSNSITEFLTQTAANQEINADLTVKIQTKIKSHLLTKNKKVLNAEISIMKRVHHNEAYWFIVIRDITEHITKNQQISRLSYALQHIPMAVSIANSDGILEYVNTAFENLTGYSYAEVIGRNVNLLKSGFQRQEFYQHLWTTIKSKKVWHGVLKNKKKNDELYWGRTTISPLVDENGIIINFIGMQEDITQQMQAIEEEKKHKEQLLATSRLATLGTLLAGVGHEINNPNNFITMNAPLVIQMWEQLSKIFQIKEVEEKIQANVPNFNLIKEKIPILLNDIQEGSNRIKNIVLELRNFAKTDDSNHQQVIQINELIKAAYTLLNSMITKCTTEVILNLEANLPTIQGNAQRIEQVLIVLIKNACEAMIEKPGKLVITSKYLVSENNIEVSVTDQGYGIQEKDIGRLTEPFFTTKREQGGTGLGIPIANAIIERHSGNLQYISQINQGTAAIIHLPVNTDEKS